MKPNYKFLDKIEREDVENIINEEHKNGYRFVAFLQYKNSFDEQIGILLKARMKKRRD